MNINILGGIAAVAALAAIFYYGAAHKSAPEMPLPAPVETPLAPIANPPAKQSGKPNSKGPKAIYHRVEQGGKQGPEMQCTSVTPFADGKSPAELAALAKQYGVSVDDLKRYYVCT